jgi:hypothetical protein
MTSSVGTGQASTAAAVLTASTASASEQSPSLLYSSAVSVTVIAACAGGAPPPQYPAEAVLGAVRVAYERELRQEREGEVERAGWSE